MESALILEILFPFRSRVSKNSRDDRLDKSEILVKSLYSKVNEVRRDQAGRGWEIFLRMLDDAVRVVKDPKCSATDRILNQGRSISSISSSLIPSSFFRQEGESYKLTVSNLLPL